MTNNLSPTVLAAFGLVVFIGGINFVAVRFSNIELAPFWGAGLRFAIASIVLFAVVYIKKLPLPNSRALLGAILYGVLGFAVSYALIYVALLQISAGLASVIMSLVPLITLFLAFVHGLEKITLRAIVGGLIAAGGIAMLFSNQLDMNYPTFYILVMLGGATAAAESAIVVKKFPKNHPLVTNAIGMGTGATILLILSIVSMESLTIPTLFSTWSALIYLIFIGSIGLFMLYLFVLSRWTASATAYSLVLMPIVTTVASAWLEKTSITIVYLISSLLVLIGVYIGAISQVKGNKNSG